MLIRRTIILVFLVAFGSPLSLACECTSGPPIQKTLERYSDAAVFTARVVQLTGAVENSGGKQSSSRARAVVLKRYWGLPWYWPKVVVLDSNGTCGGARFADGEEYLVSGDRGRYGVLQIQICTRTKPLRFAPVDLRTLDGSRCAAPGGTIIGRVGILPTEQSSELQFYSGATRSLTDSTGKRYSATTDAEGIFELRHLPKGDYMLDPRLTSNKYTIGGPIQVIEGVCTDISPRAFPYVVTGRISELKQSSRAEEAETPSVELVPAPNTSKDLKPVIAETQSDGNFFFEKVPPGEYLLGVNLTVAPSARTPLLATYYPGTTDPRKAARIHVGNARVPGSFDFAAARASLASVPVIVALPDGKLVPEWYAELELGGINEARWTRFDFTMGWNTGWGGLTGIAGRRHRILVNESVPDISDPGKERCSDPIEVDVKPGAKPVRIVLNHRCKADR